MSWQHGQPFEQFSGRLRGQGRPLAAMTAAVLAASQKPLVEQSLRQVMQGLEQIPGDIDWMAFQAGVQRYSTQDFKFERTLYPELARAGRVVLRDAGGDGLPVVLVPSMVNRGYILDLYPGQSLVGFLRERGFRVLLVDWGDPSLQDSPLTLDTVISQRLEPLIRTAAERFGPVGLFGYCMGGLLALAAAVRLGTPVVSRLAVAAMPWDFSQTSTSLHMQQGRPFLQPWLSSQPVLPGEAMAQYFWMLDPWGPIRRVMAYGREMDAERIRFLTVLEDWLADGLGLDSPIAHEMLFDWYADNRTLNGEWKVGGVVIRPVDLQMPLWVCITQKDVLVPLNASLPFIGQARGAQVVMADTGHVGLVCGRKAASAFFEPLAGWMSGG